MELGQAATILTERDLNKNKIRKLIKKDFTILVL